MGIGIEQAHRPASTDGWPAEIADRLSYLRTGIVNVYFIGPPGAGNRAWVLVDAGLKGWTGSIVAAAARRFGVEARPAAIVSLPPAVWDPMPTMMAGFAGGMALSALAGSSRRES